MEALIDRLLSLQRTAAFIRDIPQQKIIAETRERAPENMGPEGESWNRVETLEHDKVSRRSVDQLLEIFMDGKFFGMNRGSHADLIRLAAAFGGGKGHKRTAERGILEGVATALEEALASNLSPIRSRRSWQGSSAKTSSRKWLKGGK